MVGGEERGGAPLRCTLRRNMICFSSAVFAPTARNDAFSAFGPLVNPARRRVLGVRHTGTIRFGDPRSLVSETAFLLKKG